MTNIATQFKKGHKPYKATLGWHPTEEMRKKLSEAKKGKICLANRNGKWKKCLVCGKDIWIVKCLSNRKKYCSKKCLYVALHENKSTGKWGIEHPNWKGGITSKDRLERNKFKKTMVKSIFERDNYTCQMCGQKGGYLQVDHIQEWSKYIELRFSMDNCRTLCMDCHYFITYSKRKPEGLMWGYNKTYIGR